MRIKIRVNIIRLEGMYLRGILEIGLVIVVKCIVGIKKIFDE